MMIINFIIVTNCSFSFPSYLNFILLNNYKVTLYTRSRFVSETTTATISCKYISQDGVVVKGRCLTPV